MGSNGWKLNFLRAFNNWELDLVTNLLISTLQQERVTSELDGISWKGMGGDSFSVREAYRVLHSRMASMYTIVFPAQGIWVSYAPSKSAFYALEES